MKPTVLLYNFNDTGRNRNITRALLPLNFRIRKVDKENYNQPIGYIAGVKGIDSVKNQYEGEELEDEMLVMAGMTSSQIDSLIMAFRKNGIPKVNCKAVLTETNQYWNAVDLYKELRLEHETMSNKGNKN